MVVCHCCWDEWIECGRGDRQHQQEQGSALNEPLWVSGRRVLEGRVSMNLLPLDT
jgi:hypothetical protein